MLVVSITLLGPWVLVTEKVRLFFCKGTETNKNDFIPITIKEESIRKYLNTISHMWNNEKNAQTSECSHYLVIVFSAPFLSIRHKLFSTTNRSPLSFYSSPSDRTFSVSWSASPYIESFISMATSSLTFFNLHRSSLPPSSSSSSFNSFLSAGSSSHNSTRRVSIPKRSKLSYCKSNCFGNIYWIYGKLYSKEPHEFVQARGTTKVQANSSSSPSPSSEFSSVDSGYDPVDMKIVRHGSALLEDVPHLTDWLPDLPVRVISF